MRIVCKSTAFAKGIIVTSSHMAKGLEFDEVIIPQANNTNYNTLIDKSMLYVAVTRAMHKLTITHGVTPVDLFPRPVLTHIDPLPATGTILYFF